MKRERAGEAKGENVNEEYIFGFETFFIFMLSPGSVPVIESLIPPRVACQTRAIRGLNDH